MFKNLSKIIVLAVLGFGPLCPAVHADPISVDVGGLTLVLPFQEVNGTQLYSFKEGRGFPGVETNLVRRGDGALVFGGATSTAGSVAFPFVGFNIRLPASLFDKSNNDLKFGIFYGRDSGQKRDFYGIKGSVELF